MTNEGEQVAYDNDVIHAIDEAMGWIEPDGSSPSRTADQRGVDCKFLDGAFGGTGWRDRATGLWSTCVLDQRGIGTTLLAKSFSMLVKLRNKLVERAGQGKPRQNKRRWQPYYRAMWERRYRRWCCKKPDECQCQLCRGGSS